ncbi:secondary alcohol dehydrogenase [Phlyctema vagabunda]|uniref:Secondary alcohol dehydrogenase n=1 Tax=Phlyctema vagabunda TaxID=108571 RepID=A0ABR4PXD0_9HELO
MSNDSNPISPARFAEALKDLPISTLHLKAAELRNSIAHLDYSNEQLVPFTQGSEPDPDCVEAIEENEVVIKRMLERIDLLKKEVEDRGVSWTEFQSPAEVKEDGAAEEVNGQQEREGAPLPQSPQQNHNPWSDGTFQTGRIVNGEVVVNGINGTNGTSANATNGTGGSLDDDALRRQIEERLRVDAEEDDEGMHL